MDNQGQIYQALIARRSASARHLVAPGPSLAQIESAVFAASRAPDHGRLVPFRFMVIGDLARARFAAVLADAASEAQPGLSAPEIERAREKALQGPNLLALIARINANHPKIPASDQWLSVGCALENLLLALQSQGFAVAVRSGRYLETRAVHTAFGLGDSEHFVCFLAIGTASEWPPVKPKPTLEAVFSHWQG